jgi:TPP-dependent pyruvate/acetoin dehydrogenase alpha subunit
MITPQQLIETEDKIRDLWNAGELPYLTHLTGSSDGEYEQWLCDFFRSNIKPTDWVLCSHRAHYHYLLHGHTDLVEKVREGKSMFLYGERFIQSAIVAGTCGIAVGLALSIQARGGTERVWNFVGDGAEDHGHFYEAVRAAHGKQLPLTFVIEDNNSSCGMTKPQRGSPEFWSFPRCVIRHRYTPKYPHAGSGTPMTLRRTTL